MYTVTGDGIARVSGDTLHLLNLPFPDLASALTEVGLAGLVGATESATRGIGKLRIVSLFGRARKVVVVGLNHTEENQERQRRRLVDPIVVIVPGSAIAGPADVIALPEAAGAQVLAEGEIALVIGTRADNVPVADAWSHVAGLTLVNDLTAVEVMMKGLRDPMFSMALGKSFNGFKPAGPYFVPSGNFSRDYDLEIITTVNGEIIQQGHTRDYIFTASEIVSYASRFFALEPGDIVSMGAAVGQVPPTALPGLQPGDVVEIRVHGLGRLRTEIGCHAARSSGNGSSPGHNTCP